MRNRYRINNREKTVFRRKLDIRLENTLGTRMFIITNRNGTNHNYYLKVKFVVFSTFFVNFTMYEIPEVCAIEPVDALRCQKYEKLFPRRAQNVRSIRTIQRTF